MYILQKMDLGWLEAVDSICLPDCCEAVMLLLSLTSHLKFKRKWIAKDLFQK